MSIAIVPGSYDPITVGHLDLIKRALALCDEVVVAVMNNDQKTYMFTMEERTHLAMLATADIPCVRVVADAGMLVDLFDRLGADMIIKGVRNEMDRRYEEEMAAYNLAHNPRAKTVLLEASEALEGISSTLTRKKLEAREDPAELLPPTVVKWIEENKSDSKRRA